MDRRRDPPTEHEAGEDGVDRPVDLIQRAQRGQSDDELREDGASDGSGTARRPTGPP